MAYVRPITQLRNYGTSSRSTTNFNSSKDSNMSSMKTTEGILSIVWKSVSYVATILKPVASISFRTPTESSSQLVKNLNNDKSAKNASSVSSDIISEDAKPSTPNKSTNFVAEKLVTDKLIESEESFYEWFRGRTSQEKKKSALAQDKKKRPEKATICKISLEQRSRFLVESLRCATSPSSHLLRLEEICNHLIVYPLEKNVMYKENLLKTLLHLRSRFSDELILSQVRMAMSLLGYSNPPNGNGIRILSLDGGGTRGIMTIEILRQLEERTNKKIYQLFDFICGVSSGAILALLLGGLRISLDECEALYRRLSTEVFSQSPLWGTGRLMWNHAYYDTSFWVNSLKSVFGEKLLIEVAKEESSPKLAAISAIMNLPTLRAFVFRNYAFPSLSQSQYLGTCSSKMWEAIRASGAAPGYFEEFCLDDLLHQDGGIMINNPAALAIHECRLLWPLENIQCVMSLGGGRYSPAATTECTSTSLKVKVLKLIDSATDTEGVHIALNDLLSTNTYFRLNPYLTEFLYLDENRPEKLQQLKNDAQMYLRRNEYKFSRAAKILTQPRSQKKKTQDWLQLQKLIWF